MSTPAEPGQIRMWLGHNEGRILMATLAVSLTADLLAHAVPLIGLLAWFMWLSVLIALICEFVYHANRPCTYCLNETPFLDPATSVVKRDRELRAFHQRRVWNFVLFVVIIASIEHVRLHLPFALIHICALGLFAYSLINVIVHRRLQLWCPYCRHDNGGDDDEGDDDPDPTGSEDHTNSAHRAR